MRIVQADRQSFVPASHEDPRRPGVLKRILANKEDVINGQLQMINWARLPVGSSFRPHYHEDMQEMFILVQGTAEMQVGGTIVHLTPGDMVAVDPHEVHWMKNTGAEEVHYVVVGVSLGQGGKTVVVSADDLARE